MDDKQIDYFIDKIGPNTILKNYIKNNKAPTMKLTFKSLTKTETIVDKKIQTNMEESIKNLQQQLIDKEIQLNDLSKINNNFLVEIENLNERIKDLNENYIQVEYLQSIAK